MVVLEVGWRPTEIFVIRGKDIPTTNNRDFCYKMDKAGWELAETPPLKELMRSVMYKKDGETGRGCGMNIFLSTELFELSWGLL